MRGGFLDCSTFFTIKMLRKFKTFKVFEDNKKIQFRVFKFKKIHLLENGTKD